MMSRNRIARLGARVTSIFLVLCGLGEVGSILSLDGGLLEIECPTVERVLMRPETTRPGALA